jgi:hypothetical protein
MGMQANWHKFKTSREADPFSTFPHPNLASGKAKLRHHFRRVSRKTKEICEMLDLKNGSSFVYIYFSPEQNIFCKPYLYLKSSKAT